MTGSADSSLKFWTLEDKSSGAEAGKPNLHLQRSIRMEGDVLAIAVTPTEKLLAAALIDSSIQGNCNISITGRTEPLHLLVY